MTSLETNWLSRHERQLPQVRVLFADHLSVGGYYAPPWHDVQFIEGIEVPPSNGTLIIGLWDDLPVDSIMAHEWRHHWQQWNGWKYDGIGWSNLGDYETELGAYFRRSRSEFDALRYEMLRAPCEHSRWTLSLCRGQ